MNSYKEILRNEIKRLLIKYREDELEKCIGLIKLNIRKKLPKTRFYVDLSKYKCSEWDVIIESYIIMKYLRFEGFKVFYKTPNKLYIFHPVIKKIKYKNKNSIYKKMIKENYISNKQFNL